MTPYSKRGPHPPPEGPDLAALAAALKALANPSRLDLLRQLAEPTPLAEVRLRPSRGDAHSAGRAVTRTAAEKHLRALEQAGLVAAAADEGRRRGRAFAVDRAALFHLGEDLHAVLPRPDAAPLPPGPCLVAAGWFEAGRAFPLRGGGDAVIGSHPQAEVALPHDPWLAPRHAAVVARGGAFALRVLAPAEQPVRRNGAVVPPGSEGALEHGDLLALGRSALLFRAR